MVHRYEEFDKRLEQMDYPPEIRKIVIEMIRLADENITNPSKHGLVAEAQKVIEKNFKGRASA